MLFYLTATSRVMNGESDRLSDYVYQLQMNDIHVESDTDDGGLNYWINLETSEDVARISEILGQEIIIQKHRMEVYDDYRE